MAESCSGNIKLKLGVKEIVRVIEYRDMLERKPALMRNLGAILTAMYHLINFSSMIEEPVYETSTMPSEQVNPLSPSLGTAHANARGRPGRTNCIIYLTDVTRFVKSGEHVMKLFVKVAEGEVLRGAQFTPLYRSNEDV